MVVNLELDITYFTPHVAQKEVYTGGFSHNVMPRVILVKTIGFSSTLLTVSATRSEGVVFSLITTSTRLLRFFLRLDYLSSCWRPFVRCSQNSQIKVTFFLFLLLELLSILNALAQLFGSPPDVTLNFTATPILCWIELNSKTSSALMFGRWLETSLRAPFCVGFVVWLATHHQSLHCWSALSFGETPSCVRRNFLLLSENSTSIGEEGSH